MSKQREEIAELKEKLVAETLKSYELNTEFTSLATAHEHLIEESDFQINNLKQEIEDKNNQIEAADQRGSALEVKVQELEFKLIHPQSREGDLENLKALVEENRSVTKQFLTLEKTNKDLTKQLEHARIVTQNVEVLRVENDSLKSKVQNLEKVQEDNYRLELENTKMKAERNAWAAYLDSNDKFNSQSPESIIRDLSKEAEKAKQIDSIKLYYETQFEDQRTIIADMEGQIEELNKSVINSEQLKADSESSKAILNQNVDMLKRHIQILKKQLGMYEHEEQMLMDETKYDQIKSQRINELQQLVSDLQSEIIGRNNNLAALTSQNTLT
jgi:hypothetical protein